MMDLSKEVGRINGITFLALWSRLDDWDSAYCPMISLQWNKPTEPDKFAVLADQILDELTGPPEGPESLDMTCDQDTVIGKYGLMCADMDIETAYTERTRLRNDGKPLQRFLRALSGGNVPGEVLASYMSADSFQMFASAHDGYNDAASMLTVNAAELERILQIRSVIDWIRNQHPDIDSEAFKRMIPGIIKRSFDFFSEFFSDTEAETTS